jgi:hypothetical protein
MGKRTRRRTAPERAAAPDQKEGMLGKNEWRPADSPKGTGESWSTLDVDENDKTRYDRAPVPSLWQEVTHGPSAETSFGWRPGDTADAIMPSKETGPALQAPSAAGSKRRKRRG